MSTIIDNTVFETTVTVAGLSWVKADHGSYTNYRTLDGRMFIGQSPSKVWKLAVRNKAGQFTPRSWRPEPFSKPEQAQLFAALMAEAEQAATPALPAHANTPFGFEYEEAR